MKKILLLSTFALFASLDSEDDLISKVSVRLEQYNSIVPDEHVCLFLNQEKYAKKDTIFFSAFYYQSDLKPIARKRILSAGLFDGAGHIIDRINFSTVNGLSFNQLVVPPNAKPGFFNFVAFDPENGEVFFSSPLTIVDRKMVAINTVNNSTLCKFGFEGGHFVQSINNRLIVIASPNQSVTLTPSNESPVYATTDSAGLASFTIKPLTAKSYTLTAGEKSYSLPIPEVQGCALQVIDEKNHKKILVGMPLNRMSAKDKMILLVVHNRKIIASSTITAGEDGSYSYLMDKQELPNGLFEAVVLSENKMLAQRIFYNYRSKVSAALNITEKKVPQRSAFKVGVVLRDLAGNPLTGNFTFSVTQATANKNAHQLSIDENLFLNPFIHEYHSRIPKNKNARQELIDNVLALTHQSSIQWEDILRGKMLKKRQAGNIVFRARFEGAFAIPDSALFSCFLQNSMIGYEARVKKGAVELPFLYDFYGREEMFFSVEDRGKDISQNYKIRVDTLSIALPTQTTCIELPETDEYGELSFKTNLAAESFGYFGSKSLKSNNISNLNERFEDEVMGADLSVNVEEYVVFPTMIDLVKEVIPFLEVKKKKDSQSVRLLINQKKYFSKPKMSPLFVIDGVLTKDQELFLNLKPIEVFRIKIINDANKLMPFGSLGQNGIVLVETKKKLAERVKDKTNTVSVLGLNQAINKKPYTPLGNRQPDLRTTLLWIPLAETDGLGEASFSVPTSDLQGSFLIRISGKTKIGLPFETSQVVEVK